MALYGSLDSKEMGEHTSRTGLLAHLSAGFYQDPNWIGFLHGHAGKKVISAYACEKIESLSDAEQVTTE